MLPDFPKLKAKAQRAIFRQVIAATPQMAPILKGVARYTQHEGTQSIIVRPDETRDESSRQSSEFDFSLTREEMHHFSEQTTAKVIAMAQKFGEDQARSMLEVAGEAANRVGNVVKAADGEFTKENVLDIFRKVQMDFDPKTGLVAPGFTWVMHPEMAKKVVPQMKDWERDPEFNREYERVMQIKREEWRDREARRKLVD